MTVTADDQTGQRLDQWLWFARIAKSRTLAQALIDRGKVRLNKEKVDKPSQKLKPSDTLTISLGPQVRILKVLGIGQRRGPASEAQALYEELTPRPDETTSALQPRGSVGSVHSGGSVETTSSQGIRASGSGRPTKRERRDTERLKDRNGVE